MTNYTTAHARTTITKEQLQDTSSSTQLIVMEMHATGTDNRTQEVRHYPPRWDNMQTSYGDVKPKNVGGKGSFPNIERLSVSGNTASVSYPPVAKPNLIADGRLFDETGRAATLKQIAYDEKSGTFTFDRHLYGTVVADYITQYQILKYTPESENEIDIYGEILSWYNGGFARFDVPSPDKPDDFARVKFCSVVRKVIVDDEGQWEFHPDFTEEKGFGYFSGSDKPSEEAFMVDEVDVYLRYAKAGDLTLFPDTQGWDLLRPKKNTYNYKPQFIFKVAQRPSEPWAAELYDKTDFDKEFQMAKQLYSGLIKENN